jgi:hypothetical protein
MSIDDEEEDGVGADDDESINDSASEVGWNSDDDYAFADVVGKKRKNVRTHLICCVIVSIIHPTKTFLLISTEGFGRR